MRFICIDDSLCIVTEFSFEIDKNYQNIQSTTSIKSDRMVVGQETVIKAKVFRKGSLPKLFEQGKKPKPVTMEFADNGKLVVAEDVLAGSYQMMPHSYEDCEAAYIEFYTSDIQIDNISQDINTIGPNR